MEMLNFRFIVLASFAVVGILFSGQVDVVAGQQQPCKGDLPALREHCARFVIKDTTPMRDPVPECCTAMKTLDIPCACGFVTPRVEQVVDMLKFVHVVHFCGIPALPGGSQCGSFKIPSD